MSFTLEKKQTRAHPNRANGSTLIAKDAEELTIVYNKFKSNRSSPRTESQIPLNLVFTHGNGFNKSVWTYIIKQLYKSSQSHQVPWHLDTVLAIDAIGHGDSNLANQGKLGCVYMWDDGSRDVLDVIKHERETTGDMQNNFEGRTIAVGHSMGGYIALYASYLEPTFFDAVVAIDPVIYRTDVSEERYFNSLKKLSRLMKDTFNTEQEARDYFEIHSFTKNFQSDVLQDYITDEIYETKTEDGKVVYKFKCSSLNQLVAYLSRNVCAAKGMLALPSISVPIFHVVGAADIHNMREAVPWIRKAIRPDMLAGAINIEGGRHLVNSEQPDDVIKVIAEALTKRNREFNRERSNIPEIALNGEKKALFEQQRRHVLNFEMDKVYGYDTGAKYTPFDLYSKSSSSKL
ncbi:hypothetical protein KGF57_004176 [Candida theae]|uniref:AB hydrolase-1 domain-containing protein n=1 Tax=Candida theae TaxID=1198502 RepID=A0AAD5FXC6_9ASCO|nr:uncharacterized protein KGF57_004176 [Candida theae]KAI5952149.1 hypothetical protein KGF57_004176 [Candida theae]